MKSNTPEKFNIDHSSQTDSPSAFWKAIKANVNLQHQLPSIKRFPHEENLPLSFGQERLWSIDQLQPGSIIHNGRAVFSLKGLLNIVALERSLQEIVQRHEMILPIGRFLATSVTTMELSVRCHRLSFSTRIKKTYISLTPSCSKCSPNANFGGVHLLVIYLMRLLLSFSYDHLLECLFPFNTPPVPAQALTVKYLSRYPDLFAWMFVLTRVSLHCPPPKLIQPDLKQSFEEGQNLI